VQVVCRVAAVLQKHSLLTGVAADASGIGGPMTAQVAEVRDLRDPRSHRSAARKKEEFADLAAECWFAFRRLLEKREVILPVDGSS